jgi:phosphoglycerate kinase
MELKTIEDTDYSDKRVFMRADFNVPMENRKITDDTRIKSALPTINHLLDQGASLVLASHLGRPEGQIVAEMSLKPVAERLGNLLGREIKFASDCIGEQTKKTAENLKHGEILLLENLRFHKEEKAGEENFAEQLASLADCYVNDAFGTCHRKHASIVGITKKMADVAAGFLIKKEIDALTKLLKNPERPFLLILGGAKVADKIGMLKNMLDKVDTIITGGVMAYTFVRAKNWEIGDSKVETEAIPMAKEIIRMINKKHLEFHTPLDHIISNEISPNANFFPTERGSVPPNWKGVDIGPQAIEEYVDCINRAKTIFWNGPMGIFEIDQFAKGTTEMAKSIADSDAYSVIGGGDSIAAVNKAGVADKISHICTGGGASLEFLEKETLPGIEVLKKQKG